ncbi:E3 ubiquitin-protein ligase TRIM39-like isoform X2 [Puntigrus tetrazona]|uniref:E3 ubiquitin-protein ligase TRIM39-like isoform X2 n=1 Tax=Puntigrus tetrazona TaxID=1606681 RepID=UPI001C89B92B|nr:E3 ubiquitin-protein ligase TRIM39-like isoform X2 [Puntigrus tetrazona]
MAVAAEQTIALSARSLPGPHVKNVLFTVSYPFVKPNLRDEQQQDSVEIFKTFGKACLKSLKKCACKSTEQKDTLTVDESKQLIRELAAELDRVIQRKKCRLMSGKLRNKGSKEEQQYYFLQWAEELEHLQTKEIEEEQTPQTFSENVWDREMKVKRAKKMLCNWSWKLKKMKQNSVCLEGECEETLRDLHGQWKKRESSILPVMDWMMWTVLQSKSSENSAPKQWVKNKQGSKNSAGLHIPNAVWNWITKLKADVILDPNTANPDLQVSEDGKYLIAKKHTGLDYWRGFQRERCKFDGWTCVQAKEGYNAGRHYWEVDVKGKCEWRVGVVKESAPRHGYVTMNTKAGYWNLRLQLGTLIALTEPVTKLNMLKPCKIGVYLDIEEGHVSFYDVQKRQHIYTFKTEFSGTEKIYPMFGTVETDTALVISSLNTFLNINHKK